MLEEVSKGCKSTSLGKKRQVNVLVGIKKDEETFYQVHKGQGEFGKGKNLITTRKICSLFSEYFYSIRFAQIYLYHSDSSSLFQTQKYLLKLEIKNYQ